MLGQKEGRSPPPRISREADITTYNITILTSQPSQRGRSGRKASLPYCTKVERRFVLYILQYEIIHFCSCLVGIWRNRLCASTSCRFAFDGHSICLYADARNARIHQGAQEHSKHWQSSVGRRRQTQDLQTKAEQQPGPEPGGAGRGVFTRKYRQS